MLSNSFFMSSNWDCNWARIGHCERPSVFLSSSTNSTDIPRPAAIRRQSQSQQSQRLGNKGAKGVLSKYAIKPLSLSWADDVALLMKMVALSFHLNMISFTVLRLCLLGCRITCFYSCLTSGEHLLLRICMTGRSLCSFWELASCTFRVILTDSREKKEDFWYRLDKEISCGNKAFSCHQFLSIL